MRENHPADLVRELQAPRAEEGNEGRGANDPRVVKLGMGEPSYLQGSGEDEGQEVEKRAEVTLPLLAHGDADIVIAVPDVERQTESPEHHERRVQW